MTEREAVAALAGWVASRMGPPEKVEAENAHEGLMWVVWHYFTSAYEYGSEMLARCGVGLEGHGGLWLREEEDLERVETTTLTQPLEGLPRLDDSIQVALALDGQVSGVPTLRPLAIPGGFATASRERMRLSRERERAAEAERARLRAEAARVEAERRAEDCRRAEAEGRPYFEPLGTFVVERRSSAPARGLPPDLEAAMRGLGLRDGSGWTAAAEPHLWRHGLLGYDDWFVDDPRFEVAVDRCLGTLPGDLAGRWAGLAAEWAEADPARRSRIADAVQRDLVPRWRLEGWLDEAGRARALNIFGDRVTRAAAPILMERLAA